MPNNPHTASCCTPVTVDPLGPLMYRQARLYATAILQNVWLPVSRIPAGPANFYFYDPNTNTCYFIDYDDAESALPGNVLLGWEALDPTMLATLCPITPFTCPDGAAWAGFDATATLTITGVTGNYAAEFNTVHSAPKDGTQYTTDPALVYPLVYYLTCSDGTWVASLAVDTNSLTSGMLSTNAGSGTLANAVDHDPSTEFTVTNGSGTNHFDVDYGSIVDWVHLRLRGPDVTDHRIFWSDTAFTNDNFNDQSERPEVFYQDFGSGTMMLVQSVADVSARYIRVLRETMSVGNFNLREIKIFDDTWTDLMPGATISSTIGGWSGATLDEIRDGTTGSGGPTEASFADTDYIEIDLGAVYTIRRIQAWKGTTSSLGIRYKTTAFTGGETNYTNTGTSLVLSHVAASYLLFGIATGGRYVRVQTPGGVDIHIGEFELVLAGDEYEILANFEYAPPGAVAGVPEEGYVGVTNTANSNTLAATLEVTTS